MKFEDEGPEFANFLRLLEQYRYSNSERSEQFLVTECFLNLFLEASHKLQQLNSNSLKLLKFRNMLQPFLLYSFDIERQKLTIHDCQTKVVDARIQRLLSNLHIT